MKRFGQKGGRVLIACMLIGVMPLCAADPAGAATEPASTTSRGNVSDIEQLKQMLADQQRQIDELRRQLAQQSGNGAQVVPSGQSSAPATALTTPAATPGNGSSTGAYPQLGQVASTTAMVPLAAALPASLPAPLPQKSPTAAETNPSNPCEAVPEGQSPAFIRLGSTCIVPIGFMDLTAVWRDKDAG